MAYTHRNGLVLGFAVYAGCNDGDGYRLYQHVAINEANEVYTTLEAFRLTEAYFDKAGRKWTRNEHLKAEAIMGHDLGADLHWLGSYQTPIDIM